MTTDAASIADAGRSYLDAGLCVLPASRVDKYPSIGSWRPFQSRRPTSAELEAWCANDHDALCLLCGEVSGHLEALDFDAGGEAFEAWCEAVPAELLNRLVIEGTPSGGWHVLYRCQCPVCGSIKLAQRRTADGLVTLIETRGEGGLVLCAPTAGYDLAQGRIDRLPVLSEAEREVLLSAAWALNEVASPPEPPRQPLADTGEPRGDGGRPGDEYNQRGDVRALLAEHGWTFVSGGENEHWRRPGKQRGTSATLKDGVFYVFSSNAAPFEPRQPYKPFAVYAALEHGGDYEQAARALREQGYGSDPPTADDSDVDLSILMRRLVGEPTGENDESLVQPLKTLITEFTGLNRPVIHKLIREGETMNIIASPKTGKSWFVSRLAISVASGLDWLGHAVEPGRVLHIDNELHANTIAYRYRVISDAMGVPHHLYSGNIDMVSLRGRLRDLYAMAEMFEAVEPGQYKLIILDAFYRTLPRDTDENDNGAIANLYNLIDHYAGRLGCAFVLIHHTSKGNQAGKSVTDVGAGAGSQSRAADTHLILRPHEEDGLVVLESAVRTWPSPPPIVLRWQWPLFTPVGEVDASALQGLVKPKEKSKSVDMAEFIEQCIGLFDPCSKVCVHYEAAQRFGLPERKADQMLDLALERGDVIRMRAGSRMKYVMRRPGVSGEKGLWTAALLAHDPDANVQEIAQEVGVSERYVRQIRNARGGTDLEPTDENKGLTAELDAEPELASSGTSSGSESFK